MFLLFSAMGERHYGLSDMPLHSRGEWAFQFILDGSCSTLTRVGNKVREERLTGPVMVVSGPDAVHAYGGKPEDVCTAMSFHFDEAYYRLRHLLGKTGRRVAPMHPDGVKKVLKLYERCKEARKKSDVLTPLTYQIVGLELTLLFFSLLPKSELNKAADFNASKVAESIAWYQANMSKGLNIQDVAKAVHMSSTHLRRLFHKVRNMSPQEAFTQLQFDRSKELMLDSRYSLENIAEAAGFESASAFSRAFKKEFGVAPKVYRQAMKQELPTPEIKASFQTPVRRPQPNKTAKKPGKRNRGGAIL